MTGIGDLGGAVFDTDGVLTDTAALHVAAWRRSFDELLTALPDDVPEAARRPFDPVTDYLRHVDGRSREDGARAFLASRGLGGLDPWTVEELMARKDARYLALLHERGATPCPGAAALLAALRRQGVATAAVSASRNCALVLDAAGLSGFFDARVDGVDAARLGLAGKPDPALFLEAARRLDALPARTMVVEDALAGVEAGRRGGFAPVVGVGRDAHGAQLLVHGAELVVANLAELLATLGGAS